jgi:hypothetical protein
MTENKLNLEKRVDRINLLQNAITTLKSEFVGLDEVIDKISTAISPWYITPEIVNRPIVVSLWGMTGTGKSSVVKRLVELLKVETGLVNIDCGENLTESKSIQSRICNALGIDEDDFMGEVNSLTYNSVFIFDEFQYARTINEQREEISKPDLRAIWSLIDDGRLNISYLYNYENNRLINFIDDLSSIVKMCPNLKITNGKINDREEVKLILRELNYWYDRSLPDEEEEFHQKRDKEDNEDPYKPLTIVPTQQRRTIQRKLNSSELCLGTKTVGELMGKTMTLAELVDKLEKIKNLLTLPKTLNCSGSLIFTIGNLDEAFTPAKEISPDMDADTFYHITNEITISDIKSALGERFRPEQIARLGNNIIKYPTINKANFEKIIDLELSKIISDFKSKVDSSVEIEVTSAIKAMLYSEGIFPTQGVRPIYTTIESMLTPYFSDIIVNKIDSDDKVIIDIENKEDWTLRKFNIPETTVVIKFLSDSNERVSIKRVHKLQLGASRYPKARKTRYINSVHEAGHAILSAYLSGVAPIEIMSVASDHGGFCLTYDKDKEGEIESRHDVDTNIMIDLGGYLAEQIIYDRPEMRLMGSSSDLSNAWSNLAANACWTGYFSPKLMCSWQTSNGTPCPDGFNMTETYVYYFDGSKFIEDEAIPLTVAIERRMNDLKGQAENILKGEIELLKKLAIYLGEFGVMDQKTFMEFVNLHGKKLNEEFMKKQKMNFGESYYQSELID